MCKNVGILIISIFVLFQGCGKESSSVSPEKPAEASTTPAALDIQSKKFSKDHIIGWYYFKGPRLMEIREEGEYVYSVLYPEEMDYTIGETGANNVHSGKLRDDSHIQFNVFGVFKERIETALENKNKNVPHMKGPEPNPLDLLEEKELKDMLEELQSFYERWTLLPDGRLQIECSNPVFIPTWGDHTPSQIELKENIESNLFTEPGNFQMICGWKISDPNELEGWQSIDKEEHENATLLFQSSLKFEPNNPFILLGLVNACIGTKKYNLARSILEKAIARIDEEKRPFLEQYTYFLKNQIYSYEVAEQGSDLFSSLFSLFEVSEQENDFFGSLNGLFLAAIGGCSEISNRPFRELSQVDLKTISNHIEFISPDIWNVIENAARLPGRGHLLPLGQKRMSFIEQYNIRVPNFITLQIMGRLLLLRGHFFRNQGPSHYEEAMRNYFTGVQIGQHMRHGILITLLNGIAIEQTKLPLKASKRCSPMV